MKQLLNSAFVSYEELWRSLYEKQDSRKLWKTLNELLPKEKQLKTVNGPASENLTATGFN